MIGENLNYRISNATLESLIDTAWTRESCDIEDFLRAGFQKGYSVSEMINRAPNGLGYHIDPDSFVMVTESNINEMGEKVYPLVHRLDDIGLYEWSANGTPRLKNNYREIYLPWLEQADKNDTSYHFSNSESNNSNSTYSSSDTESNSSDDLNNSPVNKYEIILGVVIVVITLVAAWYLYKSIKNNQRKKENQDEKELNDTTEDSSLSEHQDNEMLSPYEDIILWGYILKVMYILIPITFIFLYKLRYYYYYRVLSLCKKLLHIITKR